MEKAPAQDSPHHILNSLNDFIIQTILRKLDRIDDFVNASKTCIRFHENAKACYPREFTDIIFTKNTRSKYITTFLQDYGHSLRKLRWSGSDDLDVNKTTLETIEFYCGNTLRIFDIKNYVSVSSKRFQFTGLQELRTDHSSIEEFECLPELRHLYISYQQDLSISKVLPFRTYPKLVGLTLEHIDNLTNKNLAKFLAYNRQLIKLHVKLDHKLTPSIFKYIAKYTPNIVTLSILSNSQTRLALSSEDLMQLGKLKQLKCLITAGFMYVSLGELINTLATNHIPIETLFVQLALFVDHKSDHMQTLHYLKTIRIHGTVSENIIFNLIRSQIALEEIHIISPNDLTLSMIEKVFLIGNNLVKVSFCCNADNSNIIINQNVLVLSNSRFIRIDKSVSSSGRITTFTFQLHVDTA